MGKVSWESAIVAVIGLKPRIFVESQRARDFPLERSCLCCRDGHVVGGLVFLHGWRSGRATSSRMRCRLPRLGISGATGRGVASEQSEMLVSKSNGRLGGHYIISDNQVGIFVYEFFAGRCRTLSVPRQNDDKAIAPFARRWQNSGISAPRPGESPSGFFIFWKQLPGTSSATLAADRDSRAEKFSSTD